MCLVKKVDFITFVFGLFIRIMQSSKWVLNLRLRVHVWNRSNNLGFLLILLALELGEANVFCYIFFQILYVGGSWGIWYCWRFNDNCSCNYRYFSFYLFCSSSLESFGNLIMRFIFNFFFQQRRRLLTVLQGRIGEGVVELDKILFLVLLVQQR